MKKLSVAWEAKPYRITQEWGVYRPEIYSQFGFTRHNGVDFAIGQKAELRAGVPCYVYKMGYQPNGGGIYVTLVTQEEYDWEDGKRCRAMFDYLHLKEIKCSINQKLEVGDLFAIPDNTGFSTGLHTHLQPRRVIVNPLGVSNVDQNDANGTFNIENYRSGTYAIDEKLSYLAQLLKKASELLGKIKR